MISTFMKSQIAAIFGTAIITFDPGDTVFRGGIEYGSFAGRAGRWIGEVYQQSFSNYRPRDVLERRWI